ncbi:hypothetical protein [Streptomyces sp. NPDC048142]|uniref:hypothetical protein n=1 Tax=Streptomyces sp. NPDC048142 TaxID=3365501 RepID=UPI0037246BA6
MDEPTPPPDGHAPAPPPPAIPPPPAYPPTPPDGPGLQHARTRPGRQRAWLMLGGALTLVLALVIGALVVTGAGLVGGRNSPERSGGGSDGTAQQNQTPRQELKPFQEAVENLATAEGLRYKDTSAFGITENEITVTAGGSKYGTAGSGNSRHDRDLLSVGGKTFLRWQKNPAPGPGAESGAREKPSAWMAGLDDGSTLVKESLDRTLPPPKLADVLTKALAEVAKNPTPASRAEERPRSVQGTPARAANTPAGRLLVTKDLPHRVLRLESYDPREALDQYRNGETPTEIPRVTTGPLAGGQAEGMDLTPLTGDDVKPMFDDLLERTKQLKDATDRGINFTLNGSGKLSCGAGGCSVDQSFTGQISAKAREQRVTGGKVTAVLSATFTIGGRPAGSCTSSHGTFPVTGERVSGSLRCANPGAGAVYSSVAAQERAKAQAQSRANGGRPVRYSIPLRAKTLVDARALAALEVRQLVDRVQRERDTANCPTRPNAAPQGAPGAPVTGEIAPGTPLSGPPPASQARTFRARLTTITDRMPATAVITPVRNGKCPDGKLSDPLPQGMSKHFVNARADTAADSKTVSRPPVRSGS